MTLSQFPKLLVVAAVTVSYVIATSPTIGVASAVGTFILNSSEVEGNANLFDGSRIQTDRASSKVYLMNGAALVLGVNSAGTIYRDHFTLSQGAAKIDNLTGYSVRASGYDIRSARLSAQALVRIKQGTVEIAAVSGTLSVFDQKGGLVTKINAGTASSLQSNLVFLPSGASVGPSPRRQAFLYLMVASALSGLGLATDAILQPSPTSP
jgi:hypothetical protein